MKKTSLILAGIILFLSQNTVGSAVVTEKITENRGYITASVEKTKEVAPNTASITFTKENSSKVLETASNENKAAISKMNAELEKLKAAGIKIEIVKGYYSVHPNYSYKSDKRNITDYTVTNSITVKTSDTNSLGKIIDAALSAGADRVSSLSFSYESTGNNCNELIWQATHEAREMAKVSANAAGQEIKGVKAISTSCYQGINNAATLRNFKSAGQSAKMADIEEMLETSVTPQKIKIRASVNAEFYVK